VQSKPKGKIIVMSDSSCNLLKRWYLEADAKLRPAYLCKAEKVCRILTDADKNIEKENRKKVD